jgi:hypothetical protein
MMMALEKLIDQQKKAFQGSGYRKTCYGGKKRNN